jgi:hypothetical protein
MPVTISSDKQQIKYDQFVSTGGMFKVNRLCLHPNDPDHLFNYLRSNGVVHPEYYGIDNPKEGMFKDKTRADLIDEILELRQSYEALEAHVA